MDKIILTLTTIPSRLKSSYPDDINSCLSSLLEQSYPDYEIHFNIPLILKTTGVPYIIPESLIKDERLKIFRTEDWGAGTKIIPTINRISNPETIIIVVDDDIVYHKELINEHIKNRIKWPECPVGYDGMRPRDSFFSDSRNYYFSGTHKNARVDILQHYKSVSYLRRFFDDDFFPFVKEYFSWNDDLLFAAYFSMKKRDRIVTFYDDDIEYQDHDEWLIHVGHTFPIIRNTQHDSKEGCNILRENKIDDNGLKLYKFVDNGYTK